MPKEKVCPACGRLSVVPREEGHGKGESPLYCEKCGAAVELKFTKKTAAAFFTTIVIAACGIWLIVFMKPFIAPGNTSKVALFAIAFVTFALMKAVLWNGFECKVVKRA